MTLLAGDATSARVEKGLDFDLSSVLCWEEVDGRKWRYTVDSEKNARGVRSIQAVSIQNPPPAVEVNMICLQLYIVARILLLSDILGEKLVVYLGSRSLSDVIKVLFHKLGTSGKSMGFSWELHSIR